MDRLASLFERFSLRASVFNAGPLCAQHDFPEEQGHGYVHVLKQGMMRVESPGIQPQKVHAPNLLFYMKPFTHRLIPLQEDTITICGTIDFGYGLENPVAQVVPDLIQIDLESHSSLCSIINLLFEEAFNPRCGRQAAMDRLCELLVIQLLRVILDGDQTKEGLLAGLADKRLAKSLVCIHDNPAHPWTLQELATEAGMSRASFAAKFRDALGMTPGEYLTHWRLGVAKSLLKKGQPITLVSDEVGYSSAAAFSRAFTSRFGATPSSWTKTHSR